ncbi:unnamed protein product [Cylicocyclus nassatus]|uniref:Uncharacterized protein n=1 Tax=Cylicocyclus nassatus TaxID=53992 RepID=A0AA36M9Y6_CYLNA|nr:unnamed protein product [Cylicocyclus nassatus]
MPIGERMEAHVSETSIATSIILPLFLNFYCLSSMPANAEFPSENLFGSLQDHAKDHSFSKLFVIHNLSGNIVVVSRII